MVMTRNRGKEFEPQPVSGFGAKFRAARLAAGLTQAQLAKHTGLFQANISLIERGKQSLGPARAKVFADALGVHWTELVNVKGDRK